LVVRRVVALVFLCFGLTLLGFVLTEVVPSNPAQANLGERAAANPAIVQAYRERYGLNKPIVERYERYLERLVLHGDLGNSELSGRPVRDDLRDYVPATAELALISMFMALIVGIPVGVWAAMKAQTRSDQVIRLISLGGMSVPPFWLALIALYLFFYKFNVFPGVGRLDPIDLPPPHATGLLTVDALIAGKFGLFWSALQHVLLPALVLAVANVGVFARFTRSAVLEVVHEDYVRTARAKGMPRRVIVPRHIVRAALPPVLTVIGLAFGNVLTGTVLVENIFAWPGIGQYAYHSATALDLPAIMGVSLFVAIVYIAINLIVDLLYGIIDPRIRVA
jgi:peptide/nickel transport system permease protein